MDEILDSKQVSCHIPLMLFVPTWCTLPRDLHVSCHSLRTDFGYSGGVFYFYFWVALWNECLCI